MKVNVCCCLDSEFNFGFRVLVQGRCEGRSRSLASRHVGLLSHSLLSECHFYSEALLQSHWLLRDERGLNATAMFTPD